jgi:hypothetical protein
VDIPGMVRRSIDNDNCLYCVHNQKIKGDKMKTSIFAIRRFNLEDMYNSRQFESYISDKLGNDLFSSDPDRADRIHKAAESGSDGSYHAEVIEDWRDFLGLIENDLPCKVVSNINTEIDSCEDWHIKNNSLWNEIG